MPNAAAWRGMMLSGVMPGTVFISRNWMKTLEDRRKRNRGNEVNDPFTEQILATEHKIIAGHKQLADFVISDEFEVMKIK